MIEYNEVVNQILERLEAEAEENYLISTNYNAGMYDAFDRAIQIVQEVAKEYDAFDVIYKKVCELEKRYDEDADVGNVNGCIRLENLLQCFKEELKAPYQKGE